MFFNTAFAAVLFSTAVEVAAHQTLTQFWVNDQTPGYQKAIRLPPNNSPITDMASNDMTCNGKGNNVPSGVTTFPAKEGDSITVGWSASAHPGPITLMLFGPVEDASTATGVGTWFKINESDQTGGVFTTVIMNNAAKDGQMNYTFNLPTGLQSGDYLLRSEILALHVANNPGGGQFYIGCAQLKITGTGTAPCGPTIQLPGDSSYNASSPAIYIPNYYNGFKPENYAGAPGGPVATCPGTGSGTVSSDASANATTTTSAAAAPVAGAAAPVAASSSSEKSSSNVGPVKAVIGAAPEAAVPDSPSTDSNSSSSPPSKAAAPVDVPPGSSSTDSTTTGNNASGNSSGSAGGLAPLYGQCGGKGWTGPTACEGGVPCVAFGDYYAQCTSQQAGGSSSSSTNTPPSSPTSGNVVHRSPSKRRSNYRRFDRKLVRKPL